MREDLFLDAVSELDTDIVESFLSEDERLSESARKRKTALVRWTALAACVAIAVTATLPFLLKREPGAPEIPVWEGGELSASQVGEMFMQNYESASTNAYSKVYVPDPKYLYVKELPDEAYLPIYRYSDEKKEFDKEEFENFVEGTLSRLGDGERRYDLIEHKNTSDSRRFETNRLYAKGFIVDDCSIDFSQYESHNVSNFNIKGEEPTKVNGKYLWLDTRKSDEEILALLEPVKQELFRIFNVSFSEEKISRYYSSSDTDSCSMCVIYRNQTETGHPGTDYIEVLLGPAENFESTLRITHIMYFQFRRELYSKVAEARIIPLEEAEELLSQGYVIGFHVCPICMAMQEEVSFDDYDFVGMEYRTGNVLDSEKRQVPYLRIPFYAFYKRLYVQRDGTIVYAKTYVPAIELSGYEEFFESQVSKHPES